MREEEGRQRMIRREILQGRKPKEKGRINIILDEIEGKITNEERREIMSNDEFNWWMAHIGLRLNKYSRDKSCCAKLLKEND